MGYEPPLRTTEFAWLVANDKNLEWVNGYSTGDKICILNQIYPGISCWPSDTSDLTYALLKPAIMEQFPDLIGISLEEAEKIYTPFLNLTEIKKCNSMEWKKWPEVMSLFEEAQKTNYADGARY